MLVYHDIFNDHRNEKSIFVKIKKKSFKTQVGQKNDRLDDLVTLFFLATVLMEDFVH